MSENENTHNRYLALHAAHLKDLVEAKWQYIRICDEHDSKDYFVQCAWHDI